MWSLGEDSASLERGGDLADRRDERRLAQRDPLVLGDGVDPVESVAHHVGELEPDLVAVPEQPPEVLHPLEVRDRDAAGIREDVRDDGDPPLAEGANGPTTPDADAVLADTDVFVVPDVLCNAGGVTVSYFEWVQDLGRLFWDRDEIRRKLADKMGSAFDRVYSVAAEKEITLRQAAMVAAIREVAGALEARGIYP